jgi:hypothetical protein
MSFPCVVDALRRTLAVRTWCENNSPITNKVRLPTLESSPADAPNPTIRRSETYVSGCTVRHESFDVDESDACVAGLHQNA